MSTLHRHLLTLVSLLELSSLPLLSCAPRLPLYSSGKERDLQGKRGEKGQMELWQCGLMMSVMTSLLHSQCGSDDARPKSSPCVVLRGYTLRCKQVNWRGVLNLPVVQPSPSRPGGWVESCATSSLIDELREPSRLTYSVVL